MTPRFRSSDLLGSKIFPWTTSLEIWIRLRASYQSQYALISTTYLKHDYGIRKYNSHSFMGTGKTTIGQALAGG